MSALSGFDPRIAAWFGERFAGPTDIQARAWPAIRAGRHVLATAPTGTGKTLTAFLWALDRLATGAWEPGRPRVLYVSPLKALNNDVRKNLLEPLRELGERGFPEITVQVRSGDTPPAERRRMLRRPPDILVTTPESLNLLLASDGGRRILGGLKTVILDEIHAIAGDKRGTYLVTAVERLVPLAGEVQRLALSATVEPLETVAAFVGGSGRTVDVVESEEEKRVSMRVCAPKPTGPDAWPALVEEFRAILHRNRSTLFFVNRRALAEQLVRWLNDPEPEPIAYAHHGSLARELRQFVERRFKEGGLKALVATASLELGIDIGDLDEVVLVSSPRTLTSAVQRVGRAGHAVGATSRGLVFPTFARDFLDAAVLAPLVEARVVEPVRPVRNPLDVLAQVVLAMCAVEERDLDDVYALMRRTWPYRDLDRSAFDRVVAMLRGRYADSHVRELKPRLRIDPESGRAHGAAGARPLVWQSGGVIPDRGYFTARVGGQKLGELDEEFVWEARPGQEFTIGTQTWRIERITRNEVEVVPGTKRGAKPPFWRAERQPRDFVLCEHVARFLEDAAPRLADPSFRAELTGPRRLDERSADELLDYLRAQDAATGLPHRRRVVVERIRDVEAGARRVVLHAPWGGRVLRPFGLALAAAWEERFGHPLETANDDDCLLLNVPVDGTAPDLFELVTPDTVETLLRRRLEASGFFAARFRENAGRALLLPRVRAGERTPLWLNRLRATKLLEATARYPDFPVLVETWRTCLEDEFDVARLTALLEEVDSGAIEVGEATTATASPFARGVMWQGTSEHMYEGDKPASRASGVTPGVLQEVLHSSALRPRLDPAVVAALEGRLRRTAPGYAPADDAEWVDHVEERLLVRPWDDPLPPGLERVAWGGGWVVPSSRRSALEEARAGDDAELARLVRRVLEGRGPVTPGALAADWEIDPRRMHRVLDDVVAEGGVLADRFTRDAEGVEYCDAENLERLLRMTRAAARPVFEALPLDRLPYFLAAWQGLVGRSDDESGLRRTLEQLFGLPAPAALWEEAIFPARLPGYRTAWLDAVLQESDLVWYGAGTGRTGFCFPEAARFFLPPAGALPEFARARADFFELERRSGLGTAELTERVWELVWKGAIVNDTYAALRKGIQHGFRPLPARPRRRGLRSWQSSRPLLGTWRPLARTEAADPLELAEDAKERARQLLRRYGVLFRELCAHEAPALRWGQVVKALRIMELSGEVVAGSFFRGGDGLQFATPAALRLLRAEPDPDAVFWLNACDPASACGLGVVDGLPPRVPSTWLVYHGPDLALVARRDGREIECVREPDARHVALFRTLLDRSFRPKRRVVVERAAGVAAERMRDLGFVPDMKTLVLERAYG